MKVCQRFTKGLLKICLWSIHWYMKVYGIYNEAILIVDLKLLIKILFLLCCIKNIDTSKMLESGVLKEILYD